MKAPFPYAGGKSTVAPIVWSRIGDVNNYVEPFFGSGAVLLARPYAPKTETVNDADGLLANVWRAIKHAPADVADHADNPVNEIDLHARHLWLLGQRERITDRLICDPDYYDAKAAGWWVWGACAWIASGWCSGNGPWQVIDGDLVKAAAGTGINRQLPHLGDAGTGINRKQPETLTRREYIENLMAELSVRLRDVRVACGDWSRVTGESVTTDHGLTGIFLDPPYDSSLHDSDYALGASDVSHEVRKWAIANGDNPLLRIALAGYENEHAMPDSWECVPWKTRGGYGNTAKGDSRGKQNAHRERLWFSPNCLRPALPPTQIAMEW